MLINPRVLAFAVAILTMTGSASAQTVVARGTVAVGQIYLDEAFPDHAEIGGSVRLFLSRRIAVQGEVLNFRSNVSSLPNEFTYSVYASALRLFGSLDKRVRPYVVGGITIRSGGIGNTAKWPYGGVGFQFRTGGRLSTDLEGGGPLLRISGSLGYRFH